MSFGHLSSAGMPAVSSNVSRSASAPSSESHEYVWVGRGLPSAFAGFRFPAEVIVVAVRWYLRYGLSYRDVEELLAERGVEVDLCDRLSLGTTLHAAAG